MNIENKMGMKDQHQVKKLDVTKERKERKTNLNESNNSTKTRNTHKINMVLILRKIEENKRMKVYEKIK